MVNEDVNVTERRDGALVATIGRLKVTIKPEGDDVCELAISGRGDPLDVARLGARLVNVAERGALDDWREALVCGYAPHGGADFAGILRVVVETPKPSVTVLTVVERDAPDDAVAVSVTVRSMSLLVKAERCPAGQPALGVIGRALWDVGVQTKRDPLGIPTVETVRRVLGEVARKAESW